MIFFDRQWLLFLLPLSVVFIFGCSDKVISPESIQTGTDYYPIVQGSYNVYQVFEIQYTTLGKPDTNLYYQKERFEEELKLADSTKAWRLKCYRAENPSGPWIPDSSYLVFADAQSIAIQANNSRLLKLQFPILPKQSFNRNALNGSAFNEIAKVLDFGNPFSVGDTTFARTLWVSVYNDSSCIGKNLDNEWFAAGVGLIKKQYANLSYKEPCNPPFFTVEAGRYYLKQWVAKGKDD